MSNSSAPEEPGASVKKIDNSEEKESALLPKKPATNEVHDKRDPSGTDEIVGEGATSKNGLDNAENHDGHTKADESDQNKNNSSPSDKSRTEQPHQSTNPDNNENSNVVKPGDASNSPKSAPDAQSVENTNDEGKEVGARPNEVHTESKESEAVRLPEHNEATNDPSKKETQDQSGTTSKIENANTTDAMDIDMKPAATESEEQAGEAVKEVESTESSEEKKEAAESGVEEMDIDSKRVDDDTNMQETEQAEEEQNGVRGEPENLNASGSATNVGSKDSLPEQNVEHDTEQGNYPQPRAIQERTGGGNDEEEEAEEEEAKEEEAKEEEAEEEEAKKDENGPEEKVEEMSTQTKVPAPKGEENAVRDSGENQIKSGWPSGSSARNAFEPRSLRPRTAGRVNNTGTGSESLKDDTASRKPRVVSGSSRAKSASTANPDEERMKDANDESTPRPIMEANGLVMRIEEAVLVTKDQLDELKIARLTDKKVKPFEELTFQDLRTYNRDQLRAYCYAYGMARRKKTEMEADMARYLSYWNKGREGFALHEYVPTSSRVIERVEPNPADSIATVRGTTSAGSASQDGSATPSTSNGKASGFVTKPSSSRAVTPSKGAGTSANSARLSASQGSSALSGGGAAGVPVSTGNAMLAGSFQAGAHRITTSGSRTAKAGAGVPVLPRGFGTSFKQKVHARHAGAKFKAAYIGAGPAIVNIVENAAAYFEGKDSPEVILDQAKSYERYQFNVDMLNEIFDGVPEVSDENDGDVVMDERDGNGLAAAAAKNDDLAKTNTGDSNNDVLGTVASRVASGKRKAQALELAVLENQFRETEERTKHTERTNMRLFQRLERAETNEQVEAVKREFEAVHHITLDESIPPPLVRRKLDKSLPPLVVSDDKCRILRFKVS